MQGLSGADAEPRVARSALLLRSDGTCAAGSIADVRADDLVYDHESHSVVTGVQYVEGVARSINGQYQDMDLVVIPDIVQLLRWRAEAGPLEGAEELHVFSGKSGPTTFSCRLLDALDVAAAECRRRAGVAESIVATGGASSGSTRRWATPGGHAILSPMRGAACLQSRGQSDGPDTFRTAGAMAEAVCSGALRAGDVVFTTADRQRNAVSDVFSNMLQADAGTYVRVADETAGPMQIHELVRTLLLDCDGAGAEDMVVPTAEGATPISLRSLLLRDGQACVVARQSQPSMSSAPAVGDAFEYFFGPLPNDERYALLVCGNTWREWHVADALRRHRAKGTGTLVGRIIDIKENGRHDLTCDSAARALRTLTALDEGCAVICSATACGRFSSALHNAVAGVPAATIQRRGC